MLDEPAISPDPKTLATDPPSGNEGAIQQPQNESAQQVPVPKAATKTDGAAVKPDASPTFGLSGGQMFMMFLTLIGIVLVAQGLRKKTMKGLPSELAEIDAIRRELAAKYPVDPPKAKPAPAPSTRQLAADMQELSDRLAGQLDAKAARIEALLQQADLRLAELKQLAVQTPDAPVARIGAASESMRSLKLESQIDPMQRRVYDLADAGMSAIDIARTVQQPTGHIELILNLRATAKSATR